MKKLSLLLLAALALVTVGSASANHDPGQNISPWLCNPRTNGQNSQPANSASPVRITYGWGALQRAQLEKFLDVQSGSVIVRNSSGTVIVNDTWGIGDRTRWSAPFPATLHHPVTNAEMSGWSTHKHTYLPFPLAPGTYSLDVALFLDKTVQDGIGSYHAGPWPGSPVTNCQFTVAPPPSP